MNSITPEMRKLALAQHLTCDVDEIMQTYANTSVPTQEAQFRLGDKEWLILTDEEADAMASVALESLIDDVVLPEIPVAYRGYFDAKAFSRDVLLEGGRGGLLARYDHAEESVDTEHGSWYIYRI